MRITLSSHPDQAMPVPETAPTRGDPVARASRPDSTTHRGNTLTRSHCQLHALDPVTRLEAAEILGCSTSSVETFITAGRLARGDSPDPDHHDGLSRDDVEQLAIHVYACLLHRNDPASYWVAGQRAAETLGVERATLDKLSREKRLPSVLHQDGTLLYRRQDLLNARHSREARTWSEPRAAGGSKAVGSSS